MEPLVLAVVSRISPSWLWSHKRSCPYHRPYSGHCCQSGGICISPGAWHKDHQSQAEFESNRLQHSRETAEINYLGNPSATKRSRKFHARQAIRISPEVKSGATLARRNARGKERNARMTYSTRPHRASEIRRHFGHWIRNNDA